MYIVASFIISSGVFISESTGFADNILASVIIIVDIMLRIVDVATDFLSPSSSLAPKRCAIMTENPPVSPKVNPRIRNEREPVTPTAASACTSTYLPTIMVSTIL